MFIYVFITHRRTHHLQYHIQRNNIDRSKASPTSDIEVKMNTENKDINHESVALLEKEEGDTSDDKDGDELSTPSSPLSESKKFSRRVSTSPMDSFNDDGEEEKEDDDSDNNDDVEDALEEPTKKKSEGKSGLPKCSKKRGGRSARTSSAKKEIKYRKDPNAPKKSKSAFIFFTQDRHKTIRSELGKNGLNDKTPDVAKIISQEWRDLDPQIRAEYDERARRDKERYTVEKSLYLGPWKSKVDSFKKDPEAPKRPVSSFLAFSNERRASVKKAHPNFSNAETSKYLSDMWKEAPEEEKRKYIEREAELRSKYYTEVEKWKKDKHDEKMASNALRQKLVDDIIEGRKELNESMKELSQYSASFSNIVPATNGTLHFDAAPSQVAIRAPPSTAQASNQEGIHYPQSRDLEYGAPNYSDASTASMARNETYFRGNRNYHQYSYPGHPDLNNINSQYAQPDMNYYNSQYPSHTSMDFVYNPRYPAAGYPSSYLPDHGVNHPQRLNYQIPLNDPSYYTSNQLDTSTHGRGSHISQQNLNSLNPSNGQPYSDFSYHNASSRFSRGG